ncbi:multimerin-2-like [Haliotis rufescens]|uniref:multimerin-2-like n=1 Tax=Haliotis rufescens TaxID=6454 RepID=UPI001EAFE87D|nr:multimerin-2-like [Haliotis rufescens]
MNARLEAVERQLFAFKSTPLERRTPCTCTLAAGSDLNISNRLEAVTARLVAMERQIVTFNSTLQDKSGQTNRISRIHVSFEVTTSIPRVSLSGNQFFKFDTVTLNIGGGYHAPTGIFEAPVTGTYLFWASILPYKENHVHVMLYKEGRRLALAASRVETSASLSYIIQVKRGEKVWFQTAHQTTVFGHSHSSYGGTLIHQN